MVTLTDIAFLENVIILAFILFLLGLFGSVWLYIKSGKFEKLQGWKVKRLAEHERERLRALVEEAGRKEQDEAGEGVVESEGDGGVPEPEDPVETAAAAGARLRALAEYPDLAKASLARASLWLFWLSYAGLQSLLAVRLEIPYFGTQYSLAGLLFLPLFGFLAANNYLRFVTVMRSIERLWGPVREDIEAKRAGGETPLPETPPAAGEENGNDETTPPG